MTKPIWLGTVIVMSALPARANDGGIAFGGTPSLLSGHPSVRMESEVVRMTVGEKISTVDCRFVFKNDGPATTVRMGFPDEGSGAWDPDEEQGDDYAKHPPKTLFTSFRSWVAGKPAATKLIRSSEPGLFWHAKTVAFPAHASIVVRDVYRVRIGGGAVGAANDKPIVGCETSYILHTGSSWHGKIGRSEVIVTFARKGMRGPLRPATGDPKDELARSAIFYKGPCRPTVQGKTLRFVRTDWHPTEKDDINLTFRGKPDL